MLCLCRVSIVNPVIQAHGLGDRRLPGLVQTVHTSGATRLLLDVLFHVSSQNDLTCGISSLLHSVNLILFTPPAHITSSQSSPSFSPSITPSTFHSRLNSSLSQILASIVTHSFRIALTDLNPY